MGKTLVVAEKPSVGRDIARALGVKSAAQTEGLIGRRQLAMMKPTAHLVNMARGPVVDEEALIEALREKKIAGAALDVFCNEPNINPAFKELDNVVLTPHVGVDSAEARMIIAHHTALNILPVLKGEGTPAFCVNRKEMEAKEVQNG